MNNQTVKELNSILSSLSREQIEAILAYNALTENKVERVELEFPSYGGVKLMFWDANNLVATKKAIVNAGLPCRKIEKHLYSDGTSQYATADTGDIRISIYPSGKIFEGCKLIEERVPVTVPEHTVAFQPAREAIQEHVEPEHVEMKLVKHIQCGPHV